MEYLDDRMKACPLSFILICSVCLKQIIAKIRGSGGERSNVPLTNRLKIVIHGYERHDTPCNSIISTNCKYKDIELDEKI